MNRKEKTSKCLSRRREIEKEIEEHRNKISRLMEEYELLGDLATRLLNEEEKERRKHEKIQHFLSDEGQETGTKERK